MKKFKVASGKIKDCILDDNGNYVTPLKRHLVAIVVPKEDEDDEIIFLNGCSEYVEPVEEAVEEVAEKL